MTRRRRADTPVIVQQASELSAAAKRTLIVNRQCRPAPHHASSRREALQQLILNEYDEIVLVTTVPGHDEYELISYLTNTWPGVLQNLVIRTATVGRASFQWNHATARFELWTSPARPGTSTAHGDETQDTLRRRA
jgi:hypothetical protein